MTRLTNRDERGVTAIIFALCTVLLFSIGGLVVDLGNAQQRHRDTQTEADFAALAGAGATGANLPAPQATPLAGDPAVVAVATYLLKNWTFSDQGATPSLSQLAANLTDSTGLTHPDADGQVYYGHFDASGTLVSNLNQLTVATPYSRVDFGLANAMGYSHTEVASSATVEIRSPSLNHVLPFYAYTGCDYGQQTLANPSNGHSAPGVMLASPDDTNSATITGVSPSKIALDDTTSSLVITGSDFSKDKKGAVTQVGFFESGTGIDGPPPVTVSAPNITVNSDTMITVKAPLPAALTSVQDTWYIRLMIGGSWSPVYKSGSTLAAWPFVVGDPLLTCGQGSSEGNFGTLQLTNQHGTGQFGQIAANIDRGLQGPLVIMKNAATPWTCTDGTPKGAVTQPPLGDPWTTPVNCVGTKTGLDQNAASSGFISGKSTDANGLLTNIGAGTGCPNNGNANLTPDTIGFGGQYTINNDTLSCFLTDTSMNIGDIDSPTYTLPGPALDSAIFNSPRFFWVPVFGTQPSKGSSSNYDITDFRPGFITDQPNSATQQTQLLSGDPNGVTSGNGSTLVGSLEVVLFNQQALPSLPPGSTIGYTGSGPKVVQLIN